jgi:hypothetical protein
MHTSSDEAFIEKCRWKIDLMDPDAGKEVISALEVLLTKYMAHLGCEIPHEVFVLDKNAPEIRRETSEGWFVNTPIPLKFGHGWEFFITSTFED